MGQMFEGRCFFFLFSFSFFFKTVPAEPLESTLSISLFFLFFFFGVLSRAGGGVGRDMEAAVCM